MDSPVADALQKQALAAAADLVVMATHGRGPLSRFWLGSVTDDLVRTLPIPLILVHPHDQPTDLAKEEAIEHILITLDGTPLAEHILEPAVTLGKAMKADFTLLRVVSPVYPVTLPAEPAIIGGAAMDIMERVETIHVELRKEANQYLDTIAQRLRAEGLKVQTRVVIEEQPDVAILDNAKPPIDMIAIETHGRGGLSRLLMGSVTDKVIRGSKLPILVHKSPA